MEKQIIRKYLIWFVIVIAALMVLFGGWQAYRLSKFRIVKITPTLSEVSTATPYLEIGFNDVILSDSLRIKDPRNIISSQRVSNKTLRLNLENLAKDIEYTMILDVSNTIGETIKNKTLSFTVADIEFDKLPKDQQDYLIENQDQQPYDVSNIVYKDFETLKNYGIDEVSLLSIKQYFYNYSITANKEFRNMSVDPTSIVFTLHNAKSSTMIDSLDFRVNLEGIIYKAHVENNILSDKISLRLSNEAGAVVYDSQSSLTR